MGIASVNPATGEILKTFTPLTSEELAAKLALAEAKARTTINNRAYSPALRHFLLLPFLFTLSNS